MVDNGKEPATQQPLREDRPRNNRSASRDRKEVAETPLEELAEHQPQGEMQTDEPADSESTGGVSIQPEGVTVQPQGGVDIVDAMELNDEHHVVEIVDPNPASKPNPLLPEPDSDQDAKAKLARLEKDKAKAKCKAKLERLRREQARGYVEERQMDNEEYSCRLTLEHGKCVFDPDVYESALQRALNTYFSQVDDVFCPEACHVWYGRGKKYSLLPTS